MVTILLPFQVLTVSWAPCQRHWVHNLMGLSSQPLSSY